MKTFMTVLIFSGLFTMAQAAENYVYIEDGDSHIFRTNIHEDDFVRLDERVANDPGTHVDIFGGAVSSLAAFKKSSVIMMGGAITNDFYFWGQSSINMLGGSARSMGLWENATAVINGGTASDLGLFDNAVVDLNGGYTKTIYTKENSTLNITGGSHQGNLSAHQNSQITISGGNYLSNIIVTGNAKIYLEGSDFQINGVPVKYGDKARDYSIIHGFSMIGTITGTLADGAAFSCPYNINEGYLGCPDFTADIVILPEPATLLMFGIGCLMLRKKQAFLSSN